MGVVPPVRSIFSFISRVVGAITVAGIVEGLLPGSEVLFAVQLNNGTKHGARILSRDVLHGRAGFHYPHAGSRGLLTPNAPTSIFIDNFLEDQSHLRCPCRHRARTFVAELMGVYFTGGSLNPARAFAPSVINHAFPALIGYTVSPRCLVVITSTSDIANRTSLDRGRAIPWCLLIRRPL